MSSTSPPPPPSNSPPTPPSIPSTPPSRPHEHLFPRFPSVPPSPMSRPASRHSRRPRSPPPPSPLSLSDVSASLFLSRIGYPRYAAVFSRIRLPMRVLLNLSNEELRDDVGVTVLAHRRALLAEFAAERARVAAEEEEEGKAAIKGSVPEFGRILVHLSNVRTFHSWIRTGSQAAIFAVALARLAPGLRGNGLARGAGAGLVCVAVATQVYGGVRYARVQRRIEEKGRGFAPDLWGVGGVLLLELGVAAVVGYVLLVDGFVMDGPG